MQNQVILYGGIGLLVGILVTIFVASNAVNNDMTGVMGMMGMRSQNSINSNGFGMMGNIDRHFIEQMIPHHQDAITMADLALQKTTHPEIKKLAEDIKKTQSEEITKMRSWYKTWYGTEVTGISSSAGFGMGMHGGMMGNQTDIDSLKNASDFDKAFIEEMIPHHQMAVMMATMLQSGTNREEMKQLAQDIITAQNKEIDDMRGWYKVWDF